MTTRWLFGDQLGPHFLDDHDEPVVLVESRAVFRPAPLPPRQGAPGAVGDAAPRRRARGPGDLRTAPTPTREVARHGSTDVEVVHPTSYAAARPRAPRSASRCCDAARVRDHAVRTSPAWAQGRGGRRLLMEDFYRDARRRHGVLMDGDRAGRRAVELRPRQPRAPAEGRELARRRRAVVADRGRHRRAGPRGPRPLGARRRRALHRPDGPRRFAATRAEALTRARALRRAPAGGLRRTRGRDARAATRGWRTACSQRAAQPRAARPARGRRAGRGGLPRRGRARWPASRASSGRSSAGGTTSGTCTGTRATATGAATRCGRPSGCRSGSPSWTPTPPTRGACRDTLDQSRPTAGCTTSPGSWCSASTRCNAGGRPRR